MFKSTLCALSRSRRGRLTGASPTRLHLFRPLLEALEDRWIPTITVTSALDNGNNGSPTPGSLRAAIIAANGMGATTIDFKMGPGLHVLKLAAVLPDVTANNVTIDGNTVLGQHIELDGVSAGNVEGLTLRGNNCAVTGLSIVNCEAAGVLVEGTGDAVTFCRIGTDFALNTGRGDGKGVYVFQAAGLLLEDNNIEDNTDDGVQVFMSTGITIKGNSVEANVGDGIRVLGETANSGQAFVTSIVSNEIDGNGANGIHLVDSSYNFIGDSGGEFNYIGTDAEGDTNEGNGGDGVLMESSAASPSSHNSVTGNVIAGNSGNGVSLTGAGTSANTLVNNLIGLALQPRVDGQPVLFTLPNKLDGVAVSDGANNNAIGGTGLFLNRNSSNGAGNLISGNRGAGVRLSGAGTALNRVQGNLIGTDQYGMTATANGAGVVISGGASGNLIGGTGRTAATTGQGNLISGNKNDGMTIDGAGTNGNQVQGNYVGTTFTGAAKLGNGGNGVTIEKGASANALGGPGLGNVISANNGDGVEINEGGTTGNVVQDNLIGTNSSGTAVLGNAAEGVLILNGAVQNVIGGIYGVTSAQLVDNVISGNKANGVAITGKGTANNVVLGNRIGTDAAGAKALPNGLDGVVVTHDAAGNVIGGSDPRAGNLISGNTKSGVLINHSAATNVVQQNVIGTSATGTAALANGHDGVDLLSSVNGAYDNLISGNQGSGLVIESSQNVIQGNRIGTDVTGAAAVPNQHDGILMAVQIGPGGNMVGGAAPGIGNLVSGNVRNGIDIGGPVSAGNLIEGNDIGTDVQGKTAVANGQDGVLIEQTSGYAVGGQLPTPGNLISGNGRNGVELTGRLSSGLALQGNRIGTDASGMAAVPNQGDGVYIHDGAGKNTVGGTGGASSNLISGNVGDGVLIALEADANVVSANQIGTNFSGLADLPNQGNGVHIVHAGGNTVGGAAAASRNLISGNALDGILIASASHDNVVSGDWIGMDRTGTNALHNGGDGVDLTQQSIRNTVGGIPSTSTPTPGNVISGNHGSGVVVTGDGTDQNVVEGNYIGTTYSGAAALANLRDGVDVLNRAANNQVGGQGGVGMGGAGNLISANAGDGVQIAGANAIGVQGNWIGTDISGQLPLGNAGHGVLVAQGATNNSIGGAPPAGGNVIAYNAKAGVAVVDKTTLHNPIQSNSIYGNGGLGIDLGDNGVTPNTGGSPHVGPNELQNFPVFPPGAVVAGSSIVVGLNSIKSTSFTIEVFASPASDPTGYGQGKTPVVTFTIPTNASGNGAVVWIVPPSLKGQYLSATATDLSGDTSEFSKAVQVM
jgi:hypothetical protein